MAAWSSGIQHRPRSRQCPQPTQYSIRWSVRWMISRPRPRRWSSAPIIASIMPVFPAPMCGEPLTATTTGVVVHGSLLRSGVTNSASSMQRSVQPSLNRMMAGSVEPRLPLGLRARRRLFVLQRLHRGDPELEDAVDDVGAAHARELQPCGSSRPRPWPGAVGRLPGCAAPFRPRRSPPPARRKSAGRPRGCRRRAPRGTLGPSRRRPRRKTLARAAGAAPRLTSSSVSAGCRPVARQKAVRLRRLSVSGRPKMVSSSRRQGS